MAKQIRVRHGINTAVSLALVVGTDTDDETGEVKVFEQEEIFLPGAVLPPNLAERHVEDAENPESHLYVLLEVFEGEDVAEVVPEPDVALHPDLPAVEPPAEPVIPAEPAPEAPVEAPAPPLVAENTTIADAQPAPPLPDTTPTPANAQDGEAPVNPFAPTDDDQ